ncbi:sulfate transporter family-domain-containing protein [Sporodiniella umbellata]|nr:sulfate transporter family-domain-containing protein [Sporodiniella umbellata]
MQRLPTWTLNMVFTIVSLLVGQAITQVQSQYPEITGPQVAVTLSLFAGVVTLTISLTRLGALVEFISEPVVAGYMTGSAITISLSQLPKILGVSGVDTHTANYRIVYEFFRHIQTTRLDAAFGLVALAFLYGIRWGTARVSRGKNIWFFLGIMRSALIVVAGTLISFGINRTHRDNPLIDVIEEVPAGFEAMSIPSLNFTVLKAAGSVLPSIVVILILEHVSVAKAFSRANNYTVNPNQEIFAIGLSNLIGAFFGKENFCSVCFDHQCFIFSAYPSTGAFSRTAVMARSGVKTPMAGVFSGMVVVLALYVLTPAFYYIPEAVLAAVVIHAVIDLMASPKFLKTLWKASILEFFIFFVCVVLSFFLDIETAIYVSVGLHLLMLAFKLSRPKVVSVACIKQGLESLDNHDNNPHNTCKNIYVDEEDINFMNHTTPLLDGLLILRPTQPILYPSANYVSEQILHLVKTRTRPGLAKSDDEKPWNDVISEPSSPAIRQPLHTILIDLSAAYQVDVTAMHAFSSLRTAIDKYAGQEIEWHFCHVPNRNVRQLLIKSGFGSLPKSNGLDVIMHGGRFGEEMIVENPVSDSDYDSFKEKEHIPYLSDTYPAFHWDIKNAVESIEKRMQKKT